MTIGQFKLGTKFTLLLILIFLGGSILSGTALARAMQQRAEDEVTARAEMLIQTMNSARDYTSTQVQPLLAPQLAQEEEFIREIVPAYAAREQFEHFRQTPQYANFLYKEATLNPTNLRDKADGFEAKLVEQFRAEKISELSGYRVREGEKLFYLSRPLAVSKESCLKCHSTPAAAPQSMIATYGSQQGFGWKLNEIVSAQTIYVPANAILAKGRQDLSLVMAIFISIFALVVVLINGLLKQTVIEPIKKLTEAAQTVGRVELAGDRAEASSTRSLVHLSQRADEPGLLARAFRRMARQLRESFAALHRANEVLEARVEERTTALAAAEAELRGLFAAMTEFIFTVDVRGRYLKVVATHPTLGSDLAAELAGKTLDAIFPAERADFFRDRIRETLNHQETIHFEYEMVAQTSERLWFSASLSPISEEAVIWVARDITERKRAEAALQESEEAFRTLYEMSADAVILLERSRLIDCNTTTLKVFGCPTKEVFCSQPPSFWSPPQQPDGQDSMQLAAQKVEIALQDGRCFFEWQYRRQDRTLFLAEVLLSPLEIKGRQIIQAVVRDLTERQEAEEAVREKEEYLRLILDNIPQQVFWKDTNSIFLGCNKNWAKATEVESPDDVVGKTDYDLIGDRQIAEFYRRQDRRIIDTDTPEFHIMEYKHKPGPDGKPAILDLNKVPIHDAEGNVVGVLGVLEDITKRKEAEKALQAERDKSERLLLNILPQAIVDRLKHLEESGGSLAEQFEAATILFADIAGFTPLSARMHPLELVSLLNQIFSTFDRLAEQHGLEKIKTIGDAYMVAGGLPIPRDDHAEAIAEMALRMQAAIAQFQAKHGRAFQIRIGINTGSVVAGVIGIRKFSYDLWGDAVNVASRMESSGLPGKIQVSEATYRRLQGQYRLEKRGAIAVKGKGEMTTYWLLDRRPS